MLIDRSDNISLITQERAKIPELVSRLNGMYDKLKNDHLILNLTGLNRLSLNELLEFLQISNKHRRAKKSFVLVCQDADFDLIPDELVVVPSLQEAYDIIEMEEIERDLGF